MENKISNTKPVRLNDFQYILPDERIAKYPLAERDASKLLVYQGREIEHRAFVDLPSYLDSSWTMFFNDTKVIPARMHFQRSSGAWIEVFLLSPVVPSPVMNIALESEGSAVWKCAIGNLKRWKSDTLRLELDGQWITASLTDRAERLVKFEWSDGLGTFAEVVERIGKLPIPPYLNRDTEVEDLTNYQTIYGKNKGAVAAPTAGLHFTDRILEQLKARGVKMEHLTLHVGAGTFMPVKETEDVSKHTMHQEQIVVSARHLQHILDAENTVAVGTTSMRTLESLYWYGVKLLMTDDQAFLVDQDAPRQYEESSLPSKYDALSAVLKVAQAQSAPLVGETQIFILPGYRFRVCDALVTNFHQPGSTLILLIAAFIGQDWQKVYQSALESDYRFLSYGDSSLLFGTQTAG